VAHPDALPVDTVKAIADQIGQRLASVATPAQLAAPAGPRGPELGETFSVWLLGLDAVTKSHEAIEKLAIQTGRWHHQVRYGGRAQAFARSLPVGPKPDDWSVTQLFESRVAERIDAAIDWVDQNVLGDPLVRLLVMPAYHLHAFWLVDEKTSQLLVVDMPDSYTRLRCKTLYSPKEFLDNLAQEQHAQGVPQ
jgi:hypothetical protein